jgi:hypothetical protein
MPSYTPEDLKRRAFERAAWVLEHHWEEQKDLLPRAARVHSRIFDTLIHSSLILYGVSVKGAGHTEHLVPCWTGPYQTGHLHPVKLMPLPNA